MPDDTHPILTAKQVAALLGISVYTVYRAAKRGTLPGVKVGGGDWRFSREAILERMAAPTLSQEARKALMQVLPLRKPRTRGRPKRG